MEENKKFVSFVSLGWYCGVAASMEKYGLRSFSSPFDWSFSDFKGVLHFLETDFEDFLQRENLFPAKDRGFRDTKYGIHFPHDLHDDLNKEYDEIVLKYRRRIEHFVQAAKEGVCYIRAIKNKEELQWIVQNQEYIKGVVRKWNSANEIKYLIPTFIDMQEPLPDIKYYVISIDSYRGESVQVLRSLFNSNEEFVSSCVADMNESIYKDNLIFELTKGNQKRDQMIVNLTKEGKEKDQTISELSREAEIKEQTIVEMTETVGIKEKMILELMQESQVKNQTISALAKDAELKAQTVLELTQDCQLKSRKIDKLVSDIEQETMKVEELSRDNQEKGQKISILMEEVKEKENRIIYLDRDTSEKERLLNEMTQKQEETSRQNASNEFKYQMLTKLHSMQYSYRKTPRNIDIYGVDHVGKIFCDSIQKYCEVGCFLDNSAIIAEYNGIPIKTVKDYVALESKKIVVTAPHDFGAISDMLQKVCGVEKENIISIGDFLKEVRADANDVTLSYMGKSRHKSQGWRMKNTK